MALSSRLGGVDLRCALGLAAALAVGGALAAAALGGQPTAPRAPRFSMQLPAAPPCSVEPRGAAGRARAAEREAEAQRARYPFSPEVGLVAWSLAHEAASCHHLAGDATAARRARVRATDWQRVLERDLRATRLRLEHALDTPDPALAARHARHLLALLPTSDGPYRRWLLRVREARAEAAP